VISVSEPGLALSLEIALRAHGASTVMHDLAEGLSALPLDPNSTLIVDGQALPQEPGKFFERLRRQTWKGQLIVLVEDMPGPELQRLREFGAILIEKPFGSADLIAQLDQN
jgi:hypothetical protein